MPCSYRSVLTREACWYSCPESELLELDGNHWCPAHLPLRSIADDPTQKFFWTVAQRRDFIADLAKRIATSTARDADVRLDGTVFPGNLSWTDLVPERSTRVAVDLSGCDFYGIADFSEAKFEGGLALEGAHFHGEADFIACFFKQRTLLRRVIFESNVNLERVVFQNDVVFEGVRFKGSSNFTNASIAGQLLITGGRASKRMNLVGTHIVKELKIDDAWFSGMDLTRCVVEGYTSIERSRIGRSFTAVESAFNLGLEVTSVQFTKTPTLEDARFGATPKFIDVIVEEVATRDIARVSVQGVATDLDLMMMMRFDYSEHSPLEIVSSRLPAGSSKSDEDGTEPDQDWVNVTVMYGTDCARAAGASQTRGYAGERGDGLSFGEAQVTVPKFSEIGSLDGSWWAQIFRPNSRSDHVLLQGCNALDAATFLQRLNQRLGEGKPEMLLYIHGFNVSFHEAARATAAIAVGTKFPGVPCLFSWPTAGGIKRYMFDEATIGWSTAHLVEFLTELGTSNLERVHIVAHSMGNRGLIGALERIQLAGLSLVRLGQLILAAPDIDAGEFTQKMPHIAPLGQRLTMYASSKDRALTLSRTVHGYARAGSADPSLTIVPPVETIDAQAVDKSFFGHLKGGRVPEIVEDIGTLIDHNTHPDFRSRLKRNVFNGLDYWAFV